MEEDLFNFLSGYLGDCGNVVMLYFTLALCRILMHYVRMGKGESDTHALKNKLYTKRADQ